MADDGQLWAVASGLHAAIAAALDLLDRLPARSFVHWGELVEDFSPQLVTTLEFVRVGQLPASTLLPEPVALNAAVTGDLAVWLLRDASVPDEATNPPTPGELEADAEAVMRDAMAVIDAAVAWLTAPGTCQVATMGPLEPKGPAGGIVGFRLPLAVSI